MYKINNVTNVWIAFNNWTLFLYKKNKTSSTWLNWFHSFFNFSNSFIVSIYVTDHGERIEVFNITLVIQQHNESTVAVDQRWSVLQEDKRKFKVLWKRPYSSIDTGDSNTRASNEEHWQIISWNAALTNYVLISELVVFDLLTALFIGMFLIKYVCIIAPVDVK